MHDSQGIRFKIAINMVLTIIYIIPSIPVNLNFSMLYFFIKYSSEIKLIAFTKVAKISPKIANIVIETA